MVFILASLISVTALIWVWQLLKLIQDEIKYSKLLKVKDNQDLEQ